MSRECLSFSPDLFFLVTLGIEIKHLLLHSLRSFLQLNKYNKVHINVKIYIFVSYIFKILLRVCEENVKNISRF